VALGRRWFTFTPDGKQITTSEPSGFVSMSIEGGVNDHFVVAPGINVAGSSSPDNQTLLFTKLVDDGIRETRALSRKGGDQKVHPAGDMPINERYPQFSPDGEWFVYSSNERGQEEVYVERYRGGAERYRISTDGGTAQPGRRADAKCSTRLPLQNQVASE
jgi:Tol biopolymer transport system component